jgi:hypothetical protein
MGGVDGTYGGERKFTQALVRKHEGKKPFERRRRRWEDTEMDLQETGWEDVDWLRIETSDDPL